jgi:hypothetical protein
MTEDHLVALALSLPETTEGAHFGTRDFRVRGKIFLTLPKKEFCVLKLTPDQQQMAMATEPSHIMPVPGGWGLRGWSRVLYRDAAEEVMIDLVKLAWRNAAPKRLL